MIALVWLGAGAERGLLAQEPAAPTQGALEEASPATPSLPGPSTPAVATDAATTPREAALEDRVRQLEAMVNQLSGQMQTISTSPPVAAGAMGAQGAPGAPGAAGSAPGTSPLDVGVPATVAEPSAAGGVGAPGQSMPPNPPPNARFNIPATLESKRANVKFGPGFEIRSDDDEYILQFHNLTQFEYRGYQQGNHATEKDSFLIPRQWFMFSGRITKPIGYFVSLANGFDTVSMLDVFMDFDFDPRFRIRAGRFKTPFTYEFFVDPIQGLILPERSVFFNNFGQNRDLGVMGFGRAFKNTLDYAGGIFNGNRNGYVANTDSKFVSAFLNWKPFNNNEGSLFENFNIGGSLFGGNNNNSPLPQTLRTVVPTAGNSVAGVPFLAFNNNVREMGAMTFWDLHTAYYYKQLAINAEWGSGFQDYAQNSALASRTHLPVQSFYVLAGYMLTGETRSGLGIVKPLRPLGMKGGQMGIGAWELTGRYQQMNIGKEVFTNGLADPNLWTNSLYMTDLGFNWHINQYLKFLFTWEHAEFGQPVFSNIGQRNKTNDLFLARMQLFF
ncbi:MAG: porin [Paludisphaera borealis]|uniref:OprO/OprP family phosphate-selective porin n=1 Tax=Paludisphaera borealis TaxID=1387353 RepID=UPI002845941C|nr:porin [Paludisphaera borealis]MDR3619977.1 porin [Paludisphaera borealis]